MKNLARFEEQFLERRAARLESRQIRIKNLAQVRRELRRERRAA